MEKPALRYLGMNIRITEQAIQKMPASPRMVMKGMIKSRKVDCMFCWIQFRIGRSKASAKKLNIIHLPHYSYH